LHGKRLSSKHIPSSLLLTPQFLLDFGSWCDVQRETEALTDHGDPELRLCAGLPAIHWHQDVTASGGLSEFPN
jgi:hypothetical protein